MSQSTLLIEPSPDSAVLEPEPQQAKATPRPIARRIGLVLWICFRAIGSAFDWIFGAIALTIGLSVLAAMPVVQFLTFGYLLEACRRVAVSGKLRAGFVGVRKASRLGSMTIGVYLFFLPLQILSSLANSAQLVEPDGNMVRLWKIALVVATALVIIHVMAACARGGRVRHFLMPFGNPFWIRKRLKEGGAYVAARDAVWDFVIALRLLYYFRLGFFGFVGTMVWLVIPVSVIAAGRRFPIFSFLGSLLLLIVVFPLPFLQAQYVVENRLRALFELKNVRQRFMRAPWAFAFAFLTTLTAAVPLYLLKIEMIPRETAWLPSVVFLAFIFPARVLTGWAYGRSIRREPTRHWFFRWTGRFAMLPVVLVYVLIVFLSQFTAWRGVWSLYEQHAFLLPVPFLGM